MLGVQQTAFQIDRRDQVATALEELIPGEVKVCGEAAQDRIKAVEKIPAGHKIALKTIRKDETILKYGVVIGKATAEIPAGSWVHLHCMRSLYDERSAHLDVVSGAPTDTNYD